MLKLHVWNHSTRVGTISINIEGRWVFAYDPSWTAFALSPYLPLGIETNDLAHQRTVEWFFENLLPEGALRSALAEREALRKDDSWGLLRRYGQDTAGALSILPIGVTPTDQQAYKPLGLDRLSEMIDRSKEGVPLMFQDGNPRMSLAGAQEKIALRFDEAGNFLMPEGTTPSTHILKPENINKDYPFCPANEWFCMSLAGKVGMQVPTVNIVNVGPHRVYVVQRFDRTQDINTRVRRLHQIDLCQARNVSPRLKYEDEAGLSAKDLFTVASNCRVPAVASSVAMSWIAFNYIIGNGDAHAKNISFMMGGQKPEIAPAYDLLCVDAYHHNLHLTMTVGGQVQAGWVEGCHWDAFALENSRDPRAMRNILARMIANVRKEQSVLMASPNLLPTEKDWLQEYVAPVITQRIAFIEDALGQPICNAKTIQEKRGIVPDFILQAIQESKNNRGATASIVVGSKKSTDGMSL